MFDGEIRIDTALDTNGIRNGLANMSKMAISTVAAIGAGISAGLGTAIVAGMNFESQMSTISAISGAGATDMQILTDKAKEMGIITSFSATESGKAFEYMAMAGWKTEDMLGGIEGIMDLAAASGENLGIVSDIVTDAMTAFGLSADQSGRFADVLASASSNANTNVGMMGETFKYVAPVAGSMGFSIEDTAKAIGLMANAGIKGSQAGTALRSTFVRLAKPPKDAQEAIEKLGLKVTNTDGSFKSLDTIMVDLRKSFANLTQQEKTQYATMLGGQEAMSGLLAIVNASEKDYYKLSDAITNSSGSAKKMSEIKLDNLKGQVTLLGSSMEGLGIAIYDGVKQPLKEAVTSGIDSVNALTESFSNGTLKASIEKVGQLLAGIVTALSEGLITVLPIIINMLSGAVNNLDTIIPVIAGITIGITTFKTATLLASAAQAILNSTMLANPYAIIAIAITGLVSIFGILAGKQKEITNNSKLLTAEKQKEINGIKESIKAHEEYKKSQDEKLSKNLVEITNTQNLWNELKNITDENGKVTDSNKARATFITGELSKALGTEISLTDNQIGNYKTLQSEIDNLVSKKRASILLGAQEEKYKNALLNLSAKEKEQSVLAQAIAEQHNKIKEAGNKVTEAQINLSKHNTLKAQEQLAQAEANAQAEVGILNQQKYTYSQNENVIRDYYADKNSYEKASVAFTDKNYSEVENIISSRTLGAFKTAENTAKQGAQEQKNILEKQVIDTSVSAGLMRERYNAGVEGVSEDMVKTAEQTARTAQEEFAKVGGVIPQKMGEGAISAQDILKNNVTSTVINAISEGTKIAQDPAYLKGVMIGGYIASGVAVGVKQNEWQVSSASSRLVTVAEESAREAGIIKSPSHLMRDKVGKYLAEGVAVGISENTHTVTKSAENLALAVLETTAFYDAEKERIDTARALEDEKKRQKEYTDKLADEKKKLDETIKNAKEAKDIARAKAEYEVNIEKIKADELERLSKKSDDEYLKRLKEKEEALKEEQKNAELARDNEFKNLKYSLSKNEITEEEYYKKLAQLRDTYFDSGSDEWEQYTQEIYKFVKSKKDAIIDEFTSLNNELKGKVSSMADKLKGVGSLTDKITIKSASGKDDIKFSRLHDFSKDISMLTEYNNALEEISNRGGGLPAPLFDELRNMDVSEGLDFANVLLSASDEDFSSYILQYQKKAKLADEYANDLYSDDSVKLKEKYLTELQAFYDEVPADFFDCGVDCGQEFESGFIDKIKQALSSATSKINSFLVGIAPIMATLGVGSNIVSSGRTTTYQFYGSGQTVSQQLQSARDADAIDKLRGDLGV